MSPGFFTFFGVSMGERPAFIEALIVGDLAPPSEPELAHLLALVGDERASSLRTVLWLIQESPTAAAMTKKLWQRAVDAMTDREGVSGMLAALDVEADLEKLKDSLSESSWVDPGEILDPGDEIGVDIPPLLSLAQTQFIACDGEDRELGQVIVRLLQSLDVVKRDSNP